MFHGAYPISGEDLTALPVKATGPAVEFYPTVLGFEEVRRDGDTVYLQRDTARIGITAKPDHRPEEAGSVAFGVSGIEAHHQDLDGRGLDLGGLGTDEWGGKTYRVFFLREAENGYCFCFTEPA